RTASDELPAADGGATALLGISDGFFAVLTPGEGAPLAFTDVHPASGGDSGDVTVLVEGSGFREGSAMTLTRSGERPIEGEEVTVGGGGSLVAARFDLRGAARGAWDLVIVGPDGARLEQRGAFVVEAGEPERASCYLVGTGTPLFDRDTPYEVVIVNEGNVDALAMCVIVLPDGTPWTIDPPPAEPVEGASTPEGEVIALQPPPIPPGQEARIRVRLRFPPRSNETGHRQIGVWSLPGPGSAPGVSPWDKFTTCLLAVGSEVLNIVDLSLPISSVCVSTAVSNAFGAVAGSGPSFAIDYFEGGGVGTSGWQVLTSAVATGVDCAVGHATGVGKVAQVANILMQGYCTFVACADVPWQQIYELLLAFAKDPNELRGPLGVKAERYLPGGSTLDYEVEFENLPEATAPAQAVRVTVDLDPSMDLTRFAFGAIHVGDRALTPPPGRSEYEGQLDLRATSSVVLEVSARLDVAARRAEWWLQAIDPGTGRPPSNPFIGFLPPDDDPPEGVGVVTFQVPLLPDTPDGARVEAQASIVFDANAPIETEVWSNTLDLAPPESSITLPRTSPPGFTLTWTSSDLGAGVADVRVEAAREGEAFTAFDLEQGEASVVFVGAPGETWSFRARARDAVGNVQDGWSPVVTTRLVDEPELPAEEGCGCD
ncbi:MAG TPA: hypothetical protein PKA64_23165, partial [Myxococcota bacterium]|nr:hypothetical protein [Myxococcota bacterium]